jgi:hypothetical protein
MSEIKTTKKATKAKPKKSPAESPVAAIQKAGEWKSSVDFIQAKHRAEINDVVRRNSKHADAILSLHDNVNSIHHSIRNLHEITNAHRVTIAMLFSMILGLVLAFGYVIHKLN